MAWLDIADIGRVQLEITNYCNAACPLCARSNTKKTQLNSFSISATDIEKWFSPYNWENLERIHICGNIDEPTLNPDVLDILEYLKQVNNKLDIWVSTNGGTRNTHFWKKLASISDNGKIKVIFGIDGLEQTNHIYRKNVRWSKLQGNFRTYIANGGYASWQFIPFRHNKHEIEQAQKIAYKEGFKTFNVKSSYNKKTEKIIPYYDSDIKEKQESTDNVICSARPGSNRAAFHPTLGNLYITHHGYCLPCCWMGTPKEINNLKTFTKSNLEDINLYTNTFFDVLGSDTYLIIKKNLQSYDLCREKCKIGMQTEINYNKFKIGQQ